MNNRSGFLLVPRLALLASFCGSGGDTPPPPKTQGATNALSLPIRKDGEPIRIPSWVTVEHAAPALVTAGEKVTLTLRFTLTENIPPGSDLRLQVSDRTYNKHRFLAPQVTNPAADGYLTVGTDGGPLLTVSPDPLKDGTSSSGCPGRVFRPELSW